MPGRRISLPLASLRADWRWWVAAGFVVLVFLTGGGSRGDIQSLLLLRPVAALVCGFALLGLTRQAVCEHRLLFWFAGAAILLTAVHLVPLPPALWAALPGRDLIVEMERAAGLASGWRPLTLSPAAGWNSLFAMLVPMAVLLIGVQLTIEQRWRLLHLVLAMAIISALLGLFQLLGSPAGPAYLFAITNNGSPVGLFANANHHAAFIATTFPMLALFASHRGRADESGQQRLRLIGAAIFAAFLLPLLLLTGSRAGLACAVIGLAGAAWLYNGPAAKSGSTTAPPRRRWVVAAIIAGVGLMVALTIAMSRARSFTRLSESDNLGEGRIEFWPTIVDLIGSYFPWGSGAGSFVETYQIHEPTAQLTLSYLNHAHNDWLEIAMTFGLPGIALLLAVVVAWAIASWRVTMNLSARRDRTVRFARMATIILLIFGVASISDYPLRAPSLACLAVIAALWLASAFNVSRQPTA